MKSGFIISGDIAFTQIDRETAELMSEFADISLPRKDKDGEYNMCKAVDQIKAEGLAEGLSEGEVKGRAKGIIETLVSLVKDGLISTSEAAKRANMSIDEFEEVLNSDNK